MKYNRLLPLLIPLFAWVLTELFYVFPKLIYIAIVIVVLLLFFTTKQFTRASNIDEKWYNFFILPACFSVGIMIFSTMVASRWFIQLLFLLNLFFLYFYLRSIFYYLIKTNEYRPYTLENLASYGNFLAFYFIASSIYGLQAFLNIPFWLLVFFLLLSIILITYQVLWANKIDLKIGYFYILIVCLVLLELAWSISFLTLSYYIQGLILAVCYYMLIGLVRFYLLENLDKKIIKMYLSFGFASILVVLLTARWI